MSKSKLNVVNPDDVIDEYGADAMRLYEMFMGPLEQVKPWQMSGVEGVYRFLERVWRLVVDERPATLSARLTTRRRSPKPALQRALHVTIKKVTEDIEALRFNTAIAQMMVFVNEATASASAAARHRARRSCACSRRSRRTSARSCGSGSAQRELIAHAPWPAYDPALCVDDTIEIAVQVNGKLRDVIIVPRDADAATLERLALASDGVMRTLDGKAPRKVIVVPGRLVNVVA